ncbi:MAG TPA: hypothetical protein VFA68_11630 [Terriglobales bacterium]|nr:hypothetical protein [Terriglobales bacterium]
MLESILSGRRAIALCCGLIGLGLAAVYWWRADLYDELVLLLQPPYRVIQIDAGQGTLTLEGARENFVVRCHELCGSFVVNGKYSMLYRGAALEYRGNGKRNELEIVEIRVKPPALPGGMG